MTTWPRHEARHTSQLQAMSMLFEIGNYQRLPHYAVIGDPTNFYIHIRKRADDAYGTRTPHTPKSSTWIKGQEAFELHDKLRQLFRHDRLQFMQLLDAKLYEYGGWFN